MRYVDRWAGVPVCFALTLLRRLTDLLGRTRRPGEQGVRRILFVKPAEQGATVLACPALRRAARRVGAENVFALVFEENRFILDVMGIIPPENVITIPTSGLGELLAGAVRALYRLRRVGIDAAVDLEFFARASAALMYLSGAEVRVGLHGCDDDPVPAPYRGDLMTHRVRYDPGVHTIRSFEAMVQAIDMAPGQVRRAKLRPPPMDAEVPAFSSDPVELERVGAKVAAAAGTQAYSPLVLLNANASDLLPLRRWPSARYVELARRLLERSENVHVAFTGAPDEAGHAAGLVRAVGSQRCFSMAGRTTLGELLVLYCLADVLVTNDSGPAHFAALTPIEVVTLFGPETPALFGSPSPRTHAIWKGLECSPCVSAYNNRLSPCRDNQCMQRITVDEVLELVCELCEL